MKNCLTCKYEPEWGEPTGSEYPRRHGRCKKEVALPKLPAVCRVLVETITIYSDNSGMPRKCATWEQK